MQAIAMIFATIISVFIVFSVIAYINRSRKMEITADGELVKKGKKVVVDDAGYNPQHTDSMGI